MSDCFVLYLLLTCMKKKTSGADKFTNNNRGKKHFKGFCIPEEISRIKESGQRTVYK